MAYLAILVMKSHQHEFWREIPPGLMRMFASYVRPTLEMQTSVWGLLCELGDGNGKKCAMKLLRKTKMYRQQRKIGNSGELASRLAAFITKLSQGKALHNSFDLNTWYDTVAVVHGKRPIEMGRVFVAGREDDRTFWLQMTGGLAASPWCRDVGERATKLCADDMETWQARIDAALGVSKPP
jgi:hypothetical protein